MLIFLLTRYYVYAIFCRVYFSTNRFHRNLFRLFPTNIVGKILL